MRQILRFVLSGISSSLWVLVALNLEVWASTEGWDRFFPDGWKTMTNLGYGNYLLYGALFVTGGATSLWMDYWLRRREEIKRNKENFTVHSAAAFKFLNNDGELIVEFNGDESENVAHWAWYVNNGGTRHNESVLICVEFETPILDPAIYGHAVRSKWREFSSTNRSAYVEFEGWPEGEIVIVAIASKALGLDRRQEKMIWRNPGPLDSMSEDKSSLP